MDKKEKFINLVDWMLKELGITAEDSEINEDTHIALEFFEAFKTGKSTGGFTENGKKILQCMKDTEAARENLFKAKELGEDLFMSSRSVSGAMRKLTTDGYVTKVNSNPVVYSLTDLGREISF